MPRNTAAVGRVVGGDFDAGALNAAAAECEVEPHACRHVLLILAAHADNHGECFPTTETVADAAGMQLRMAKRALAALRIAGIAVPLGYRGRARVRRLNLGTNDVMGMGSDTGTSDAPVPTTSDAPVPTTSDAPVPTATGEATATRDGLGTNKGRPRPPKRKLEELPPPTPPRGEVVLDDLEKNYQHAGNAAAKVTRLARERGLDRYRDELLALAVDVTPAGESLYYRGAQAVDQATAEAFPPHTRDPMALVRHRLRARGHTPTGDPAA